MPPHPDMPHNHDSPSPRQDSPEKIAAEQKLKKMWRTVRMMCCSMSIACAFWIGLGALGYRGTPYMVANLVVVILALVSMNVVFRWMLYDRRSRSIRNLCRKCEYDLTGLDEPELCPECGTKIDRPPQSNVR